MSGGRFEYKQMYLRDIISDIHAEIERGEVEPEVMQDIKDGLRVLATAYVYAQRIDWYLSGDDGKEAFKERLLLELDNVRKGMYQKNAGDIYV